MVVNCLKLEVEIGLVPFGELVREHYLVFLLIVSYRVSLTLFSGDGYVSLAWEGF